MLLLIGHEVDDRSTWNIGMMLSLRPLDISQGLANMRVQRSRKWMSIDDRLELYGRSSMNIEY